MVYKLETCALLGNLLEMQNLWHRPTLLNQNFILTDPQVIDMYINDLSEFPLSPVFVCFFIFQEYAAIFLLRKFFSSELQRADISFTEVSDQMSPR